MCEDGETTIFIEILPAANYFHGSLRGLSGTNEMVNRFFFHSLLGLVACCYKQRQMLSSNADSAKNRFEKIRWFRKAVKHVCLITLCCQMSWRIYCLISQHYQRLTDVNSAQWSRLLSILNIDVYAVGWEKKSINFFIWTERRRNCLAKHESADPGCNEKFNSFEEASAT